MFSKTFAVGALLLMLLSAVTADGNDWVDVDYLLRQQTNPDAETAGARNGLVKAAGITARNGPWSVQTPADQLPPSKNRNDYLSFAPYYWPDCNWCPSKRELSGEGSGRFGSTYVEAPSSRAFSAELSGDHPEIMKRKRYLESIFEVQLPSPIPHVLVDSPVSFVPALPISGKTSSTNTMTPTSSENVVTGTLDPAQARAKPSTSSKCTPSPTTSMAPSATWTSCPYKNKDGQPNPDTRNSAGPVGMNDMSQAVLYNALSYAITGTPSYSQKAASFIEAFFIAKATAMTPNINYGQIIRGIGPEHQKGTFTGVLDMRGIVKVVNAILALKVAKSPDWDENKDMAMKDWMRQYVQWMETSEIAKKTSNSANNHATFFYGQLAAAKTLIDDVAGAREALNHYFNNQFLDHIAASGEQPFEAVRGKPYHYRCFNLEAMITAAKLGDYLGMDFWTAKTRNGATIQSAVDFTIQVDPGSEPITNVFPHVAAIAAAYGDPGAKYAGFLQAHNSAYKNERFWLYDQPNALKMAPAVRRKRRELKGKHRHRRSEWNERDQLHTSSPTSMDNATTSEVVGGQNQTAEIDFKCPAVFNTMEKVELDNGLFVTCDQLKPFYVLFYPDQESK